MIETIQAATPVRVRLQIWGFTQADARLARMLAARAPGARRWNVVEEAEEIGPPCTLSTRDCRALAQGSDYEFIWAVYPVTEGSAS